jgi:hypothetical protein
VDKKLLTVEIPEGLYDEFWTFAGLKGGPGDQEGRLHKTVLNLQLKWHYESFSTSIKSFTKEEPSQN